MRTKSGMIKGLPVVKSSIDAMAKQYRAALRSHDGDTDFTFRVPATADGIRFLKAAAENHRLGGGSASIDYMTMTLNVSRGVASETAQEIARFSATVPADATVTADATAAQ